MKKGRNWSAEWSGDWSEDWGGGSRGGGGTPPSVSPANTERDLKPISPQRRVRSASSIRRRNASRIQKYVLFITLLSVVILFYQQRLFLPSHDLGTEPVAVPHGDAIQKPQPTEANPKPKHKSKPKPSKHRSKPSDKKAAKAAPVDQSPIPSPPPKLQQHFDAEPQDKATNGTEEQKPEAPREPDLPAEPAEVAAEAVEEVAVGEDHEEVMVDENKDAPEANFSLSNFNHADPCNSTLARMTAENVTFLDNERNCGSVGLPIKMTPDLYKLPDLSNLFVHCENWKDALSSSVAQTELTASCLQGANSTLPLNARQVLKPYQNLVKRFNRRPLSCAVVGSSSQIFSNPDFGKQIDKHHVVIRLNQAPTNGSCAQYTGTKTTIRILNGRWTYKYIHLDRTSFLPLEKDSMLIISRTTGKDYQRLAQKLRVTRPDVSVRLLSREVIGVTKSLVRAYKTQAKEKLQVLFKGGDTPSSGLVALVIALNACSKVSLYGFGVIKRNFTKARYARKFYHYFSHMMGQQSEDDTHSFDAELALMASMGQYRTTVTFCGINRNLNYSLPENYSK